MNIASERLRIVRSVCWYLNHHSGNEVKVDTIAQELDIEWAEAYNSIIFLQRVQNIAPEIDYDEVPIVKDKGYYVNRILDNSVDMLLAYVFHTALEKHSTPKGKLDYEGHKETFSRYEKSK